MKQLIIIMGMISLGVFLFNLMAGSQPESLKSVSLQAIRQTMEAWQ